MISATTGGLQEMDKGEIIEHLKRNYSTGIERADFLVEVAYHRRRLISDETASAIIEILNQPICTGVIFGQLATKYYQTIVEDQNSRSKIYGRRRTI
jgi:hypothetical protein